MPAIEVGYSAISTLIKLVAGDIDRIPNLARAVTTTGSVIDRLGKSIRGEKLTAFR